VSETAFDIPIRELLEKLSAEWQAIEKKLNGEFERVGRGAYRRALRGNPVDISDLMRTLESFYERQAVITRLADQIREEMGKRDD
jgi:hypothetical protein